MVPNFIDLKHNTLPRLLLKKDCELWFSAFVERKEDTGNINHRLQKEIRFFVISEGSGRLRYCKALEDISDLPVLAIFTREDSWLFNTGGLEYTDEQ